MFGNGHLYGHRADRQVSSEQIAIWTLEGKLKGANEYIKILQKKADYWRMKYEEVVSSNDNSCPESQ